MSCKYIFVMRSMAMVCMSTDPTATAGPGSGHPYGPGGNITALDTDADDMTGLNESLVWVRDRCTGQFVARSLAFFF